MAYETLKDIAKEIEASGKPKRMRVRRLLLLVGQERRGKHVTKAIRRLLRRHRLKCHPDFANVHIDTPIWLTLGPKLGRPTKSADTDDAKSLSAEEVERAQLVPTETPQEVDEMDSEDSVVELQPSSNAVEPVPAPEGLEEEEDEEGETEEREVIITIRQGIPAGGRPPMLVRGSENVQRALTQMLDQDFSQLVVANGRHGRVEGIFSWQSYGEAVLAGRRPERVQDCMNHNFAEVNEEKPLFDAVREVIRHGILVVRSRDNTLCGFVTHWDVAEVFIDLSEPFLFLGQIENHLRDIVERMHLSQEELQALTDERDTARAETTTRVDDLTLGELIRAIQNPDYWQRLGLNHDRAILLNRLERVRKIRNRIMHFDADGITPADKTYLKETRRIVQGL